MNTSRDDRHADVPHPAYFQSDHSPQDGGRERPRPGRDPRGKARGGAALDDGEKPGRSRRRPLRKGPRDEVFSEDRGKDGQAPKGSRRGPAGYDRRSSHDRLRDYPRRHDWHDPADDLDDDELL